MKNRRLIAVFLILSLIIFSPMEGKTAKKKKISFQSKNISLYVGQKKTLKVATKQKRKNILFSSANKKIATINAKGRVTAKKVGKASITARVKGTNKKANCTVRVGKYLKSIRLLSANTLILKKNDISQIRMSVQPKTALTGAFTYHAGDHAIVTVSKTGKLTAKKPGLTKVQVKSVGVTAKKRKLSISVNVYVSAEQSATPNPSFSVPEPSTNIPTTPTPTEGPTSKPLTLQERINNISPPPITQLLADTIVVDDNGDISTLYFINKSYTGNVTISLNGKQTTKGSSAKEILKFLEEDYLVMTNSSKTIRVSRNKKNGDIWWTITDLTLPKEYYLRAWQNDIYKSPYGLIIMKGDTTKECIIY